MAPDLVEPDRGLARSSLPYGRKCDHRLDTPIEECIRRDPKGLYAKTKAGEIENFTGLDSPHEEPEAPEMRLTTIGAAEAAAIQIIDELRWQRII